MRKMAFDEAPLPLAAGIAITAPGGMMLFLKRSKSSANHPGTWAFPGGGVEENETPEEAARREATEEIGYTPQEELSAIDQQENEKVNFTTFHHSVNEPFLPKLNDEHSAYAWAPISDAPRPLHPNVKLTLKKLAAEAKLAGDRAMALDRATVRSMDRDGRMHVKMTNISKANICPYYGREIPGWDHLGLDPDRVYKLYRDPAELEKGMATFNNLPLLEKHIEVTAMDPKKEHVIGSTGTDAVYAAPYLKNSLVIWDGSFIKAIENEEQKELSCAYRYRADMTPGSCSEGDYDGVMRDIIGNHVALVKEGRAGSDVVVGDSKEEDVMASIVLTRKAALAQGALSAFLIPKLAQDKKLDLRPLLKDITAANFKAKKPDLVTALTTATKNILAQDADISDVVQLLDTLDQIDAPDVIEEATVSNPDTVVDSDLDAGKSFLKGKLSEDDFKEFERLNGTKAANDADKDAEKDDDKDKDKDKDKPVGDTVSKAAMDAAIKKAASEATANANKVQREIRDAEREVRPYVGEIIACDSAEQVYRTALKAMNVEGVDNVHSSALQTILKMQPMPGAKTVTPRIAADAAGAKTFHERYPDAQRISAL